MNLCNPFLISADRMAVTKSAEHSPGIRTQLTLLLSIMQVRGRIADLLYSLLPCCGFVQAYYFFPYGPGFLHSSHLYFILFKSPAQNDRSGFCVLEICLQDPDFPLRLVDLGDMVLLILLNMRSVLEAICLLEGINSSGINKIKKYSCICPYKSSFERNSSKMLQ